jgi:hypothetical protein
VDGRISPATAKGAVDTADVVEIGDFSAVQVAESPTMPRTASVLR